MILRVLAFVAALAAFFSPPAPAVVFGHKEFNQLVDEAQIVFIGTVAGTHARKIANDLIVTDIAFREVQTIKGTEAGGSTAITVLGGTLGDERIEIGGVPHFQPGARYVVFSKGNGRAVFPVVGGDQGMFRVMIDSGTGQPVVLDADGKAIRQDIAKRALSVNAAAPVPGAVPLDAFVRAIRTQLGTP